MDRDVALPGVNNNGDTRETLISQASFVYNAAKALDAALAEAAPHGRNYQTLDPLLDRHRLAFTQHREHRANVRRIMDDYEAILVHLAS